PGRESSVTMLPHPTVNLVYDRGTLLIAGVGRARFTYPLSGSGQVFGVKFRPGGFAPFLGGSAAVAELTDSYRPLSTLWGDDAEAFARDLGSAADLDEQGALAER